VAIVRLSTTRASLERVPTFVADHDLAVVFDCVDANTIICAAALRDQWTSPIGVWLEVSHEYPAQMCARDVKTLSWLVELDNVVVSAADNAHSHAQVVRALLTNDEVNFSNEVATLIGAYNRPAPARALHVWSSTGGVLENDGLVLSQLSVTDTELGQLSAYA
jgi:hypothetical protein